MRAGAALVAAALAALAALAAPRDAAAAGLEIPDNGGVAMGRAGAFVARASDPTALMHNVAGIAALPGVQLVLGGNFGMLTHCFQREGEYPSELEATVDLRGTRFESSGYSRGGVAYPRTCNEPAPAITPHLLLTYQITPHVSVGVGVYGPNSTGSRQTFPDVVDTPDGPAPSPVRHMVFRKALLLLHPTLAAAFAPVPWLRFGAALQPSYAQFTLGTMVNTRPDAAQSPNSDALVELNARGWFLAGNLGVQVVPSPYLSFGAHAHLNAQAHLRGHADVTAYYYAANEAARTRSRFDILRMTVPLPWTFRLGGRFAMPRAGRPRQNALAPYDPMTDEVFDVEVALSYETTSRLGTVTLENAGSVDIGTVRAPAPATVEVRSDYHDVIGLRVGGDYNVVPGRLAVRAGVAHETAAQDNRLAQIHVAGYASTSVHLGASLRVGWLTATVAFAHFVMADHHADQGARAVSSTGGMVTQAQCDTGSGQGACMTNRGVYQASFTVASLGLGARF